MSDEDLYVGIDATTKARARDHFLSSSRSMKQNAAACQCILCAIDASTGKIRKPCHFAPSH
jgi:hypothetical protein